MLAKPITYTDFNGETRTETFYFNLSRTELIEMQNSVGGGYDRWLKNILEANNSKEIMATIRKFILAAYGEKSSDGRRFVKSSEAAEAFAQTAAYDELFYTLVTSDEAAAEFINAIVPTEVRTKLPANK